MKILYIFMGIGAEYVLQPLASFLKNKGYDCLEIDLMSSNLSLSDWKDLSKQNIVYITSAHLDKGKERAKLIGNDFLISRNGSETIAPLELIDILKPIKSIYIPHDLTEPLGLYEWKFIDQFDLFLNPIAWFSTYSNIVKTEDVGWIKYQPDFKTVPNDFIPRKKIIFVSLFDHLQATYGIKGLFQYFSPLLDENTAIKFPFWNNHKEVENYFRKKSHVQICEAHWNSTELIQHFDVVITNHMSSILKESAFLNKKVICLESNIACPPQAHFQRSVLGCLPNIQFYPYEDAKVTIPFDNFLKESKFIPLAAEDTLKPFDFEKAVHLIEQCTFT